MVDGYYSIPNTHTHRSLSIEFPDKPTHTHTLRKVRKDVN